MCAPLFVIAFAFFASLLFNAHDLGSPGWGRIFASRAFATYTLISLAGLLMNRLVHRSEVHIGRTLPSRATRTEAVSLRMMLGRVRLGFILVAVTVEGAMAVILLVVGEGWFGWSFLGAYSVTCLLVAIGVRQAASRPAVAMDPVSLAIDERLRSEDALNSIIPLESIIFAFPSSSIPSHTPWLDLVWLISLGAVLGVGLIAKYRKPWNSVRLDEWAPGNPIPYHVTR
jgi:hypothetical protein